MALTECPNLPPPVSKKRPRPGKSIPKWWNLIPATPAVPAAAAANQQNDKYDVEKRGGIHVETPPGSAVCNCPPQPTFLILIRSYEPVS
jgi:hypothetical protein